MSDPLHAARLGDALSHTSMMADILKGVLEVVANARTQISSPIWTGNRAAKLAARTTVHKQAIDDAVKF